MSRKNLPRRKKLRLRTLNVSPSVDSLREDGTSPGGYISENLPTLSSPPEFEERGDPSRDTFSATVCGLADVASTIRTTQPTAKYDHGRAKGTRRQASS